MVNVARATELLSELLSVSELELCYDSGKVVFGHLHNKTILLHTRETSFIRKLCVILNSIKCSRKNISATLPYFVFSIVVFVRD